MFRKLLAILVTVAAALLACTSEDDTPLGSEFLGDILGSEPGVVFEDTVLIAGDTVLAFHSLIDRSSPLELGRADGYERTMLLRFGFPASGDDVGKVVESAQLRIFYSDTTLADVIPVRFHSLGTSYNEGDSVSTLDTLGAIVDPESGSAERVMQLFPRTYDLPVDLVQGWIRGDSTHNGIAIVYTDPGNDKVIPFRSRESADVPTVQVFFDDETFTNYRATADGTLIKAPDQTDNLIISDGAVRRVYFPLDLEQISDSSAVHRAEMIFNIVEGSTSGGDLTVQLYLPNSDDVTNPGIITGRVLSSRILDDEAGQVVFPITFDLLSILSDDLPNNGIGLRFGSENSELRYAEFYGSNNPALAPRLVMTYSTPAVYE